MYGSTTNRNFKDFRSQDNSGSFSNIDRYGYQYENVKPPLESNFMAFKTNNSTDVNNRTKIINQGQQFNVNNNGEYNDQHNYREKYQYNQNMQNPSINPTFDDQAKFRTRENYDKIPLDYANNIYTKQNGYNEHQNDQQFNYIDNAREFFNSSLNILPISSMQKAKIKIPLAMSITPFKQNIELPLVSPESSGLIRCSNCRGYINCFVNFSNDNSYWICNLCKTSNKLPPNYYSSIIMKGIINKKYKPELVYTAHELVATPEYMNRPPMIPTYLAAIDVSKSSVQSGFLNVVCDLFIKIISEDQLPGLDRAQFCLITYDSEVHFYKINDNKKPTISVIIPSQGEVFLPTDEPLIFIKDNKKKIIDLFEALPTYWRHQKNSEISIFQVLSTVSLILNRDGGKVILFQCTPISDNFKSVKQNNGDSKISSDPVDGLKVNTNYYSSKAAFFSHSQIGFDMIIAPLHDTYMSLSSTSALATCTGGKVFYYPGFSPEFYRERIIYEVGDHLSKISGWEGVLKTRFSRGLTSSGYYGQFGIRGADLMVFTSIYSSTSIMVTADFVENSSQEVDKYVQFAFLYSTSDGQRRIRIINHHFPATDNLKEILENVNLLTCIHIITLKAVGKIMSDSLSESRIWLQNQFSSIITTLNYVFPALPPSSDTLSPLNYENPIQVLVLVCANLLKNVIFRDHKDVTSDTRHAYWIKLRSSNENNLRLFYLPVLYEVSNIPGSYGQLRDDGTCMIPPQIRLSQRNLNSNCAYLLCDGDSISLWLGKNVDRKWLQKTFCVQDISQIHPYSYIYMNQVSSHSVQLNNIINYLRKQSDSYVPLIIYKQSDPFEAKFIFSMNEDTNNSHTLGFVDLWLKLTKNLQTMYPHNNAYNPPVGLYNYHK